MIDLNVKICPKCGGDLKHYDKVKRIIRTKGGKVNHTHIRRFKCKKCNSIHREIPNFIFPYKQYEAEIIIGVLDSLITSNTLGFEDYPCELTMRRWIREISNYSYEESDKYERNEIRSKKQLKKAYTKS